MCTYVIGTEFAEFSSKNHDFMCQMHRGTVYPNFFSKMEYIAALGMPWFTHVQKTASFRHVHIRHWNGVCGISSEKP